MFKNLLNHIFRSDKKDNSRLDIQKAYKTRSKEIESLRLYDRGQKEISKVVVLC